MTGRRESLTTLIDFESRHFETTEEPDSLVQKKSDLSGGRTMWQARLVLSTLDPTSHWAAELRNTIRTGDICRADALLDAIYARNNTKSPITPGAGPRSQVMSTVLPPAPQWRKLEAG
jgi:hypothetical protein